MTVVLLKGAAEEAMVGINKYKGFVNSEKMVYVWQRRRELSLGYSVAASREEKRGERGDREREREKRGSFGEGWEKRTEV